MLTGGMAQSPHCSTIVTHVELVVFRFRGYPGDILAGINVVVVDLVVPKVSVRVAVGLGLVVSAIWPIMTTLGLHLNDSHASCMRIIPR